MPGLEHIIKGAHVKYYGETWPTGAQSGGPAITTQPAVRDRTERVAAMAAHKVEREELPAVLAAYKPAERAS